MERHKGPKRGIDEEVRGDPSTSSLLCIKTIGTTEKVPPNIDMGGGPEMNRGSMNPRG